MNTEIIYDGQYGERCETLDNAAAEAWTRIATYGDVPNRTPDGERVTQRFEKTDAEKIVATFANNWAKIRRLFGVGSGDIPVVRGHTDTGNVDETTVADTTQYGRITALAARDDGLYAQIEKTPEFGRLLANGAHLEYSPTWRVAEAADKVFRPFRLISLGMVPKGNLRNATLVNSISGGGKNASAEPSENKGKTMEWTDEQKQRLAEILGTDADKLGDAEAVIASVSGKLPKKAEPEPKTDEDDEKGGGKDDDPKKKTLQNAKPDGDDDDPDAEARAAKAKTLVNAAFADETIFASEVAAMTKLATDDYDGAKSLLDARRAKLAKKPRSATLENAAEAAKKKEREEARRDAKIATMVNARIAEFQAKGMTPPKPHVLWAQCEQELD